MKKIEDIPKKNIFEIPEGYFDKLPGVIQARIAEQHPVREQPSYFALSLRYALPVIALVVASVFIYQNYLTEQLTDAESIMATVSSEDLVDYLDENDITIDEILDHVDAGEINPDELNTLELEVSEGELMELSDEFENDQL